ncbi:MAG: hypothetical protein MJD61_16440 [Proteobacteria bacterium]|nr:hypothetical protein [Pseudomonadota bacterium]
MARWLLLLCVLGVFPAAAQARTGFDYGYQRSQTWPALVRLVRVDLGFEIAEKDLKNGYLLFKYREGPRSFPGSAELLPSRHYGKMGVRIVIHVPSMPQYVERMLLDRLQRKLRDELGQPFSGESGPPAPANTGGKPAKGPEPKKPAPNNKEATPNQD